MDHGILNHGGAHLSVSCFLLTAHTLFHKTLRGGVGWWWSAAFWTPTVGLLGLLLASTYLFVPD